MAKRSSRIQKDGLHKVQPKLRMFANGNSEVNAVRAAAASAMAISSDALLRRIPPPDPSCVAPVRRANVRRHAQRGSLKKTAADVVVNVFVQTAEDGTPRKIPGATAQRGNLVTARVSLSQLQRITLPDAVERIDLGEPLTEPVPIISSDRPADPGFDVRRFGDDLVSRHQYGKDVLIGIIDVQGFDFAHEDFLDSRNKTRFVRIWDQGATQGQPPKLFAYGNVLTAARMNAALAASRTQGLPATMLEPQSQMVPGSHGTHVASIAAGNRGVCRNAMIAGVLVSLPPEDWDRRKTFFDSTRLAHAVDYLVDLAKELGAKAMSINVSLGTNGHAHDGSSPICRWIDAALCEPGRAICAAAGNAGQEKAEFEGDIGYVVGRIHTKGRIAAPGLTADIDWVVAGNGVADVSENELEIWYNPQDRFSVSVRPPGGEWSQRIGPGEFIENQQYRDGSMLSVYNELYHAANGCNVLSIYLSPFFSPGAIVGIQAGQWTVRIFGDEVRDGRYHGWIERDDPRPLGRNGAQQYWNFPSFFSERSNVDESAISSLACGERLIAVANLDEAREKIHISSSQGPTRDGRAKPDIAAPGTEIVAANGFHEAGDAWISMTGTSMASPAVCGMVGLMLAIQPRLTAAQIIGIMRRTGVPLPGSSFDWRDDAGYGRIDPNRCLEEAAALGGTRDVTR